MILANCISAAGVPGGDNDASESFCAPQQNSPLENGVSGLITLSPEGCRRVRDDRDTGCHDEKKAKMLRRFPMGGLPEG
jgi:hypothetical protein